MTTENVKAVRIDTQSATTSVKSLRNELKQLKDVLLTVEEGTEEYNKAIQRAGDLQHQLREQMEEINASAMDFGQIVGNTTKAAAGLAAGFQSVQAVMSLMGSESEDVTKAIQKMQSIMALTQGIAGIDNGIKAFKRLSLVLKNSTPVAKAFSAAITPKSILLLTTAVTALVAIWERFGDSIENALPFITKIKDAFNDIKTSAEEAATAQQDYLEQVAAAEGKLEEFKLQQKINKLNKEAKGAYDELSESIKGYNLELESIVLQQQKDNISREEWTRLNERGLVIQKQLSAAIGEQKRILADTNSYIEKNTKSTEKNTSATKEANEAKDTFFENAYAELEYNKAISKEYAETKTALEDLLYIQELHLQTLEEGTAAWYNLGVKIEETKQKIADFGKAEVEEEPENAVKPGKTESDYITEAINASALALTEFSDNPAWGNILKNVAVLSANWDELHKKIKDGGKDAAQAYLQIFSAGFAAVGQLMEGLANEQDETSREGFEQSKKFQIASATMSMLSGIVSAWASAMQLGPIAGPIAGAILTAMMSTTGGIQIAKIKKMQFGDTNGGVSTPSATAVTQLTAPVQYTQDVQGASIEQSIKNTKVYVTETDISNTQRKVSVTEAENRF